MLPKLRSIFQNPRQSKLAVGIIILLVIALPLIVWYAQKQQEIRQRASENPLSPPTGGVQLELSSTEFTTDPSNISITSGQKQIQIILHAGTYNITGVDFTITTNKAILPITQFTPSTSFNSVLTNSIDENGTLHFVATSTDVQTSNSGNVSLGTITVNPAALGSASIAFGTTQITALGTAEALPTNYVNKNFIVAVPTSTPAPTAIPSPTPNPYITNTYSLGYGWNGIGISVNPSPALYAVDMLNRTGCSEIDTYIANGWESYKKTVQSGNFQIQGGHGYFLRCDAPTQIGQLSITGTPVGTLTTLFAGWNLVSVPIDANGNPKFATVDTFVNAHSSSQLPYIKEVDVWENGGWTGYTVGLPVNKFALASTSAYFVKFQTPGFTVSALSLPVSPTNTPPPPTNTPIPIPTSTPVPIAGDVNNDRELNILDYNIWRNEFLKVVTTKQSDLNKDTKIDLLDFNLWRTAFQNFVTVTPTSITCPPGYVWNGTSCIQNPTPTEIPILPISNSYKRVFVTEPVFDGNLSDASGADAKCQDTANNSYSGTPGRIGLGGTWKAWIGRTSSVGGGSYPAINFTHATVPYKLVDGTLVANNWIDLTDGSLQNPINKNSGGLFVSNAKAWTNVRSDGNAASYLGSTASCVAWDSNLTNSYGYFGLVGSSENQWTSGGTLSCNTKASLYCFEQ